MTTYSETDIRRNIEELLAQRGLTWEEFLALGEADELLDVDVDLDFAFRNLVPHLKDTPPVPA